MSFNIFLNFHHPTTLEQENGVFILTSDDVDLFLHHHDYSVIVFYTPWSHKSEEVMPVFEEVAQELSNEMPPIPFAKIDVEKNPDMVKRYTLHEVPQVYFFIRGKGHNLFIYKPEKQKMIDFIRRVRAPHSTIVKDESSLEMLNAHHRIVVGYFGPKDEKYQAFQGVTQAFEDILFVHSHDEEFKESIGHDLVVFKNYEDQERSDYHGNWTTRDIKNWLIAHRYPSIQPFNDDEAFTRIFSNHNPSLILFSDQPAHDFQPFIQVAYEHAEKHSNLIFCHSLFSTGLGHRLAEYIGVKIDNIPSIWAIRPVGDNFAIHKHQMKGEITLENLNNFIEKFKEGKLERHYRSDHVIKDASLKEEGLVKHSVGRTFEQDITNTFKHTLVVFYYHWCLDTKKMLPVLDILAESFSNNPKLDFFMFDLTMNEHPDVEDITDPKEYPVILYYDPRDKSVPIKYKGDFEEKPLKEFINKNLGFDYIAPIELTKRRRREIMIAHGHK